jgi:uncharacterized protein YrrD
MIKRATGLIGKPVISTSGGEMLGKVADLLLDDATHRLAGIVVARGILKSEEVLPADAVQSFGRDAVVSNSAELIGARDWREGHDPSTHATGRTEPPSRTEVPRVEQ